ncbi:MAG: hypothetical protein V7603_47 [Micromonosporaceae bacterium]
MSTGTLVGNYVANGRFDQSDATQNPPLWGADLSVALNTAIGGTWTTTSVSFVVSTGTAQIAFWSNAGANQWLSVDNVAVWAS